MGRKKKNEPVFLLDKPHDSAVEIHVTGDILSIPMFNQILNAIHDNRGKKRIDFVAYTPKMMLLIRESIPKEYYNSLDISCKSA